MPAPTVRPSPTLRQALRPAVSLVALAVLAGALLPAAAPALVLYDGGQRQIQGVQLLRDADDPSVYYYLPQFPRLATKEDGTFEFLCLKYVGDGGDSSGGLFHALVQYDLPQAVIDDLQKELEEEVPGARIAGPVRLLQADEETEGIGSFEVVSAILADADEGGFTRSMVTSGRAPLLPGSKAVVAALLDPRGATLLWDSFTGPTSDVSVAINAWYEAKVEGYRAKVTAKVETVYEHFSRVQNFQENYTRRQVRRIVDELQQSGGLEVEVFDRSEGLGLEVDEMDALLQLVTDKLVELMFDAEAGWAQEPERETAVEAKQIQGRQERGWFSRVFGGAQNTKYFSDDQFVLKRREDIRRRNFVLDLSKSATVKVPVSTAGNLGGLFEALGEDERYFRIVDMRDPAFEHRQVHFQVDGGYADAFDEVLNSVSVSVRKRFDGDRPDMTTALVFDHASVSAGQTIRSISFPRLGATDASWTEFEYQVAWSVRDGPTLRQPEDGWNTTVDPAVSLVPPFTRREVMIDADRALFTDAGFTRALVEFAVMLGGEAELVEGSLLRADDPEPITRAALHHDRGHQVAYRVSWFGPRGTVKGRLQVLDSDYLFLLPPEPPSEGGEGS